MTSIEHILYKLNKYNTKIEQNNNNKIFQKYLGKDYCLICYLRLF